MLPLNGLFSSNAVRVFNRTDKKEGACYPAQRHSVARQCWPDTFHIFYRYEDNFAVSVLIAPEPTLNPLPRIIRNPFAVVES
jgi:hypothetical protein